MYNQVSEFIRHKFRTSLIETKYMIVAKPSTSGNIMSHTILEWIHRVIGNLVQNYNITQTYVYKYDPWLGILAEAEFSIISTTNSLKGYSPVQFI